jgi:hypothetical protein
VSRAPLTSSYEAIVRAVVRFGRFRKRWTLLGGAGRFVAIGIGALLAWFLIDWVLPLPAWPLVLLFAAAVGVLLFAAVQWVLLPSLRRVRPEREAIEAESLHGRLDNQLIGSLQLGREVLDAEKTGRPLGYSPVLVHELVHRTHAKLPQIDLPKLVDRRPAYKRLRAGGAVLVVALACLIFAWPAVAMRVQRLADAWASVLDSIFQVELTATPGDIAVVRGRPLSLGVQVKGARRDLVTLIRTDPETGSTQVDDLALRAESSSFHIPAAEKTFRYQFEYGGRRTPQYTARVGDLPDINAINFEMAFPAYTGQSTRTLSGRVPRLDALAGTGVLVSFAATTDLHPEQCYVEWQDGSKQQIPISGRFGHFSFTVGRPDRATIHLTGEYGRGFEMASPLSFEIAVQRDTPPVVTVPLKNRKLTLLAEEAAMFALPWSAEDDFGVAEVNLEYRIDTVDELLQRPTREGSVPRRIEPAQDRVKGTFAEMFKTLDPPLEPGDRITITVWARDNNTEDGPGTGRSLPVEIVVVRPDLAAFVEQQYAFESQSLLSGLRRVKRATDLLVEPDKSVRTETAHAVEKQTLKSRVSQEAWPSGSEDATGDYFRLLSGEK